MERNVEIYWKFVGEIPGAISLCCKEAPWDARLLERRSRETSGPLDAKLFIKFSLLEVSKKVQSGGCETFKVLRNIWFFALNKTCW